MGQVFSNLIGNALQYSHGDSTIDVTIADRGERVSIAVHNDGDPIPLDKQKTIFHSRMRGTDGGSDGGFGSTNLGLGLFIAHKVVTAHGGTISVDLPPPARHLPHSCLSGEGSSVSGGTPHKEPNPWQGLNHPHRPAEQPSQGAGWIEWPF